MEYRSRGKNLKILEEIYKDRSRPSVHPKSNEAKQDTIANDIEWNSAPVGRNLIQSSSCQPVSKDSSSSCLRTSTKARHRHRRDYYKKPKSKAKTMYELFGSDVTSSSEAESSSSSDSSDMADEGVSLERRRLRVKPVVNYNPQQYYRTLELEPPVKNNKKVKKKGNAKAPKLIKQPTQVGDSQDNKEKSNKLKDVSSNCKNKKLPWPEYWDFFLLKPLNREQVAPVHYFKHAPFADVWKGFATQGLVIEAPNPYAQVENKDVYWIATIREFAGYRALIEFERFRMDNGIGDWAWIPFCSDVPKPLGFSDRSRSDKLLRPSADVAKCVPDFMNLTRENLCRKANSKTLFTLQEKHSEIVAETLKHRKIYPIGTKLEVIDINSLGRNQVVTVTGIIGDRIHVTYGLPKRAQRYDTGHFLNSKSEHVHPLGWSGKVGHDLYARQEDFEITQVETLFSEELPNPWEDVLKIGLAFEVRHPEFPFKIVPAVVAKVLAFGYFMAQVVKTNKSKDTCKMCFHITSPYIFCCGFARSNGMDIYVDGDVVSNYSQCQILDFSLVSGRNRMPHNFKEGMKMEAVDLCLSNMVVPATIVQIAGHLLKLHFDGRPKNLPDSYQWVDAETTDIYPLGWAEMVGHKFSGFPESVAPIESKGPKIRSVETVGVDQEACSANLESDTDSASLCDDILQGLILSEYLDYEMGPLSP